MLKSKVTVDVSSILSYITKQWHTLKVKMFKGLLIQLLYNTDMVSAMINYVDILTGRVGKLVGT